MECPAEILPRLTNIIGTGLLSIRIHGSAGHAERCAIEANHIHNLPNLIADYRPELLKYYWEIERVAYLRVSQKAEGEKFKEQWNALATFLKADPANRTGSLLQPHGRL